MKKLILLLLMAISIGSFAQSKPEFIGAEVVRYYKKRPIDRMVMVCLVWSLNDKSQCEKAEVFTKFMDREWESHGFIYRKDHKQKVKKIQKFYRKFFNKRTTENYYSLTRSMGAFCHMGMGVICPAVPFLAIGETVAAPFIGLYQLFGNAFYPVHKRRLKKKYLSMLDTKKKGEEVKVSGKYFRSLEEGIK